MKSRHLFTLLSVCGGLLSAAPPPEFTNPVGFRSFQISAGADTAVVPSVTPFTVFSGTVGAVTDATLTLGGSYSDSLLPLGAGRYYLQAVNGVAAGATATITTVGSGSVTLEASLAAFGLAAGDAVKIVPHWTLNTMFRDGKGIDVSYEVFAPATRILVPDTTTAGTNLSSSKVYFYHDGSELDAGWYTDGDVAAGLQDDVIIPPDSYILVRKSWDYEDSIVTLTGEISLAPFGTIIRRVVTDLPQDNAIGFALASDLLFSELGLESSDAFAASPSVFAPVDRLLIYNEYSLDTNPSASLVVFYHDGSQLPAGWYQEGNIALGQLDNFSITGGSRLVLRRSGGAPDAQLLSISPAYLTNWDN